MNHSNKPDRASQQQPQAYRAAGKTYKPDSPRLTPSWEASPRLFYDAADGAVRSKAAAGGSANQNGCLMTVFGVHSVCCG